MIHQQKINSQKKSGNDKMNTKSSIAEHFRYNSKNYKNQINLALYANLQDIFRHKIFEVINENSIQKTLLINFYSIRMEKLLNNNDEVKKLYWLYIRILDTIIRQNPKRRYSILFFSSHQKQQFEILKNIYRKLPYFYFELLSKIYIVQPSFFMKNINNMTLNSWQKYFNSFLIYIQDINKVILIKQIKQTQALKICPQKIRQHYTPPISQPIKIVKVQSKTIKKFAIELNEHKIHQETGIPLILMILVQNMQKNKSMCMLEGIFRKAGSIDEEYQIIDSVYQMTHFDVFQSQYSANSISGVIKKFFTELITPIIPYKLYELILKSEIKQQNCLEFIISEIIPVLPSLNCKTLQYTIMFLKKSIITEVQSNKMNIHNISVIFYPCFFRSQKCCLDDLLSSGKFAALLKIMIEKYENIEKYMNQQINKTNVNLSIKLDSVNMKQLQLNQNETTQINYDNNEINQNQEKIIESKYETQGETNQTKCQTKQFSNEIKSIEGESKNEKNQNLDYIEQNKNNRELNDHYVDQIRQQIQKFPEFTINCILQEKENIEQIQKNIHTGVQNGNIVLLSNIDPNILDKQDSFTDEIKEKP